MFRFAQHDSLWGFGRTLHRRRPESGFFQSRPGGPGSVIPRYARNLDALTEAVLSIAEMLHFVQHDKNTDFGKTLRPELTCEASGSILIPECVHRIRPSDRSPSVRRDRRVSHAERCCAMLHHAVRQPERRGDGPRSLKTGRTRGLDRPVPLTPGQLSRKARGRQQALSHPSA